MRTKSWFTAFADARSASYALAVFAAILVLFAVPARADTVTQSFSGITAPASTLGLSPFDTTLGTLDSISDSFTFYGTVPDGDSGGESVEIGTLINFLDYPGTCPSPSGCVLPGLTISTSGITDPAVLSEFLSAFTQTFTTSGTVNGAMVSGSLAYTYTPAPAATPEPGLWSLLLIGIGTMWLMTRRRRDQGHRLPTEAS